MFQIDRFDTRDPLSVIKNINKIGMVSARLNKSIENNISIEINDGNSS